jgi:hypothetical protein
MGPERDDDEEEEERGGAAVRMPNSRREGRTVSIVWRTYCELRRCPVSLRDDNERDGGAEKTYKVHQVSQHLLFRLPHSLIQQPLLGILNHLNHPPRQERLDDRFGHLYALPAQVSKLLAVLEQAVEVIDLEGRAEKALTLSLCEGYQGRWRERENEQTCLVDSSEVQARLTVGTADEGCIARSGQRKRARERAKNGQRIVDRKPGNAAPSSQEEERSVRLC